MQIIDQIKQVVEEKPKSFGLSAVAVVIAVILLLCGKVFDLGGVTLLGALVLFVGLFAPLALLAVFWPNGKPSTMATTTYAAPLLTTAETSVKQE
jgi:hypothetical protein